MEQKPAQPQHEPSTARRQARSGHTLSGERVPVLQQMLDQLSAQPYLWSLLRRIVEHGFRGEQQVIARELAPWRDPGRRMFLDFGCGTGEFAACFPAGHYVGIDLSPAYLRFAQRSQSRQFVAASGTALALADQRFDAALVLGVLHHLADPVARAALIELHRVLRPGATLLVLEDIPPPDRWNIAGRAMHWLDRGGNIRDDAAYRLLFHPEFTVIRTYTMRSGICDYGVYVLRRNDQ